MVARRGFGNEARVGCAVLIVISVSMIACHSIFWLLLIAPGFAATRYAEVAPSSSANAARRDPSVSYTYQ